MTYYLSFGHGIHTKFTTCYINRHCFAKGGKTHFTKREIVRFISQLYPFYLSLVSYSDSNATVYIRICWEIVTILHNHKDIHLKFDNANISISRKMSVIPFLQNSNEINDQAFPQGPNKIDPTVFGLEYGCAYIR